MRKLKRGAAIVVPGPAPLVNIGLPPRHECSPVFCDVRLTALTIEVETQHHDHCAGCSWNGLTLELVRVRLGAASGTGASMTLQACCSGVPPQSGKSSSVVGGSHAQAGWLPAEYGECDVRDDDQAQQDEEHQKGESRPRRGLRIVVPRLPVPVVLIVHGGIAFRLRLHRRRYHGLRIGRRKLAGSVAMEARLFDGVEADPRATELRNSRSFRRYPSIFVC